MIKLEHVVLASPEQMEFIIEGMRNPMNSWEKKDSREGCEQGLCWKTCKFSPHWCGSTPRYIVGENDYSLMQRLASAGTEWHYSEHKDWYDKFFEITEDLNIELHTSLPNVAGAPYDAFDRVVYHLHSLEQLYSIKRQNCAIVRVVFVVTENFTEDLINRIAVFCANSDDIDELSFRQMVDNRYQETYYCYEYLKAGHKKLWWYIEQNDYNLYYCQNKVYTEYKNIGR